MSTYATDTFAGDDSTVEFTLTFDYLSRDHIKVFRVVNADGAETELSVITTGSPTGDEFIWESDNKIKVGTAPTVDQTLKIQRDTPEDQQLVPWSDGSYLISEDLNDSDKQWLYNIQELSDLFTGLSSEAIKYRGTIDLTVDAAPANPSNGDFYINSGSGTVVASWTGLGGDNVTGSEQVIYNSTLGEWELLKTPASQKGVLEVTGTAPIQVDNTDAQRPVVSVDAATTTDPGVITEAASDGITYGRENGAWVAVANTAVSANPPANPSNGDGWYDLNTGRLYLWINDGDSSQWAEANPGLAGGGASVEVADTAPPSPADGDLWWDSSDDGGRLYVWYEDGSTNQWVEASPQKEGSEFWGRTGTTLSPATAGDDVDLGTGDLSAAAGTFSGDVKTGNQFLMPAITGTTQEAFSVTRGNGATLDHTAVRINYLFTSATSPFAITLQNTNAGTSSTMYEIDENGNHLIGGTLPASPNIELNSNGELTWGVGAGRLGYNATQVRIQSTSKALVCVGQGQAGTQQVGTGFSAIVSERRLKNIIGDVDLDQCWDLVRDLKLREFYYKDQGDQSGVPYAGPIIDELEKLDPALILDSSLGSDDEGQIRTFNQPLLTMKALGALSAALTRIEALEAEVQSLKGGSN